ncbi:hypothetical protein F5B20DRAFT_583716 [Whalleya microplaca]|nr:hypothetical protein F5B20DRAFT_583716 [Whalleya microplaca]
METIIKRAASFPNWTQTPIPHFELSSSGLIALADLGTIAQRTRLVGGSSWLDALLLAPGLHYQQAADALDGKMDYSAVELYEGKTSTYNITNTATLRYLKHVGESGQKTIVDVGRMPDRNYFSRGGKRQSQRGTIWQDQGADLGWYSHVLYLASPVLTIAAFVFMILLRECQYPHTLPSSFSPGLRWGVALLLALMFSRILNIWVIKQRTKPPVIPPPKPDLSDLLTEYLVDLGHGRSVCLRGMAEDLQAITTTTWLSAKTHVDGYLEAAAKLTVYLVAAFSGNMTQVGSIIFMVLLLVTAGLLGLSNAHAKTLQMHGRFATPTVDNLPRQANGGTPGSPPYPSSPPYPDSLGGSGSWPASMTRTSTGFSGLDDMVERGQVEGVARDRHAFDDAVEYKS